MNSPLSYNVITEIKGGIHMKNKIKNILYGLFLSVISLGVCFIALAAPFQLFNEMSSSGIKILFLCEIAAYSVIALICLVIKDKKEQKKQRQRKKQLKRNEKIKKMQNEWMNIAA